MRIGAVEAGGTKMVCALGDELGNITRRIEIPTTTPEGNHCRNDRMVFRSED